jgi:hypothetical protein
LVLAASLLLLAVSLFAPLPVLPVLVFLAGARRRLLEAGSFFSALPEESDFLGGGLFAVLVLALLGEGDGAGAGVVLSAVVLVADALSAAGLGSFFSSFFFAEGVSLADSSGGLFLSSVGSVMLASR